MNRWMECPADEWVKVKFFAYLHNVDSGGSSSDRQLTWQDVKPLAVHSLLIFIVGFIGNLMSNTQVERVLFAAVSVLAFPILIYRFVRLARNRYVEIAKHPTVPDVGTSVPYLLIRNDGIQVNAYGLLDEQAAPFISWSSITALHLRTVDPQYVLGAQAKGQWIAGEIGRYIKRMERLSPSTSFRSLLDYQDQLCVVITHHDGYQSQLPLPSEWLGDGRVKSLLSTLESVSGLVVAVEAGDRIFATR